MSDKAKMPAVISAKSKDPAIQKFYDAVKEHIEVRDGQRGDINEAYVRVGDLVDGGIVNLHGRNPDGSIAVEPVDPLTNTTRPPAPTGFTITTAFSHVMMGWESWTYSNHSHTEIWRSDTNSLGDATKIGTSDGVLYADSVDPGSTHYYWIRFISDANVIGPYNATAGTAGTTAQSVTQLMDAIGDEIESSDLASGLLDSINTTFDCGSGSTSGKCRTSAPWGGPLTKPDGGYLVAGDLWYDSHDGDKPYRCNGVGYCTNSSYTNKTTCEAAGATWVGGAWVLQDIANFTHVDTQITEQVGYCERTQTSTGNKDVATSYATLATCTTASQTGYTFAWKNDVNLAQEVKSINSTVDGNSTSISVNATAINGLEGKWVVKIDNNGAVSGFGLASGGNVCMIGGTSAQGYKDGLVDPSKKTSAACVAVGGHFVSESEFHINADRFAIIDQGTNGRTVPFSVVTTAYCSGGGHGNQTACETAGFGWIPAGTYIDTAMIKDASIASAKIASLEADKINAATLSAITANIGTATAGLLKGPDNRFKIDLNNGYLTVYDASGNLRVRLGKLS